MAEGAIQKRSFARQVGRLPSSDMSVTPKANIGRLGLPEDKFLRLQTLSLYGLLHRPARRNVETRTLGAAELPFNGVPQILQQVEAVEL
jgi:hypothetical protein